MKNLIITLAFLTSFATQAQDIVRETWTCKDGNNVMVKADFTFSKTKAIFEGYGSKVKLTLPGKKTIALGNGLSTTLNGEDGDSRDGASFVITLIRPNDNDEFSYGEAGTQIVKAKAVVVTLSSQDCVGERADANVYECSVKIVRE